MMGVGEAILLGIYLPIVLGGFVASWLWCTRWLVPKIREQDFDAKKLLLGLSSLAGMLAHAVENAVFGAGRWMKSFAIVNELHWLITGGKVLIVISIALAIAAFARPVSWASAWAVVAALVLLWSAAAVFAVLV